jgi:hypothetical protein
MITVLEGYKEHNRPITAIKEGDIVRTMNGKEPSWTKVTKIRKAIGDFEFIVVSAQSKTDMRKVQLNVTTEHGMLLRNDDGSLSIDAASNLVVGDSLATENNDVLAVTGVDKTRMGEKYILETTDGSVLASGVLVSTICGEEVSGGENLWDAKLKDWQSRHNFSNN